MVTAKSRLTRFQAEILEAFFRNETRFFLTGGGALAGYHLGHRETHDLDLFTVAPVMDDGVRALRSTATALGASWQEVQTAPEFRRILLSRGDESVVVDLVVEHAEQLRPEKPVARCHSRRSRPRRSSPTSCAHCSDARRSAIWSTSARSKVSASR